MEWRRELAEEYSGVRPDLVLDSFVVVDRSLSTARVAFRQLLTCQFGARYNCEHKRDTVLFQPRFQSETPISGRVGERITIVLNVQSLSLCPYFGQLVLIPTHNRFGSRCNAMVRN